MSDHHSSLQEHSNSLSKSKHVLYSVSVQQPPHIPQSLAATLLFDLKFYHGEARILWISCQVQAMELQSLDCLSKITNFQSNWTSSAEISKKNGPQKQNYDPVDLDNASLPVSDVWGRNTCSLICRISSQCPFMSLLTKGDKGEMGFNAYRILPCCCTVYKLVSQEAREWPK